jgi:hypothetical protein
VISTLFLRRRGGSTYRVTVIRPERRWRRLAAVGMHRAGFPLSTIAGALGLNQDSIARITEGGLFAGFAAEIKAEGKRFDREIA